MVVARVFGKSSPEAIQRENDRLAALQQLDLLDTPRDEGFERIVRLIKQIFSIDIGIISLIDGHRQWYKACSGLAADEVSLEDTFCRCVVDCDEPVIVQDATKDARFLKHSAVTGEDHIRFYAGVPLRTKAGHMIGTVCAIDRQPRSFGSRDLSILLELAGAAMDRIDLMQSAATDSLTEAMTRRAFKQEADQLISLALRHQHDLSCIVFDIDHFKQVNDRHGHAAGDAVLKAVASACKATFAPVICSDGSAGRNSPSCCRMSTVRVQSPSPKRSEPPSPRSPSAAIMVSCTSRRVWAARRSLSSARTSRPCWGRRMPPCIRPNTAAGIAAYLGAPFTPITRSALAGGC